MNLTPRNSSHEEFLMPGASRVPVKGLSDHELERRLLRFVAVESEATADIVEHIAEFELRRLFAPKRFPTMFEYCTKTFGYSEGAAYLRIYAGRLSIQYPEILDLLRTRRLHLTAIRTVGPHLKPSNFRKLIIQSLSKTERELKFLIAKVSPKPEPAEVVRHEPRAELPIPPMPAMPPAPSTTEAISHAAPAEPSRARIEPLTPQRVRFAFTGSEDFLKNVERVRQLLRHKYPAGTLEDVFAETVECFLDARDPARKARAAKPRATNPRRRSIPVWIRDIVFKRDGGRCTYTSSDGLRCEERGGLEYDHILPWAKGGASNDPANVRLLCRTHNALEAARIFGPRIDRGGGGR
jgi:hypothetical protein